MKKKVIIWSETRSKGEKDLKKVGGGVRGSVERENGGRKLSPLSRTGLWPKEGKEKTKFKKKKRRGKNGTNSSLKLKKKRIKGGKDLRGLADKTLSSKNSSGMGQG